MAEEIIELHEHQQYKQRAWVPDKNNPWITKQGRSSSPPDEISLPGPDWGWSSNWKYEVKAGITDREGWEYASNPSRYDTPGRTPKPEKLWSDTSRRRLWTRAMKKKEAPPIHTFAETTPKVQNGLKNIHLVRVKIEEIMMNDLDAADSSEMLALVAPVKNNILHICRLLDVVEERGVTASELTVINKLRNDISKEESAITRAVSRPGSRPAKLPGGFTPLQKNSTFAGSSSSILGGSTATSDRSLKKNHSMAEMPPPANDGFLPLQKNSSFGKRGVATGSGTSGTGGMDAAAAAASNGVKRGTAGSFDPSLLSSTASPTSPGEGMFVPRSGYDQRQVQVIEKKLKPVDESEINLSLIEERTQRIEEMNRDIVRVKELFTDLSILIKEQEVEIERMAENIDESHARTATAFGQIMEANELQKESCAIS